MHRIQCSYCFCLVFFCCNIINNIRVLENSGTVIRVYSTSYSKSSYILELWSFILQASVFLALSCFYSFHFPFHFFSCSLSTMPPFALPAGLLFLFYSSPFSALFLQITFSSVPFSCAAFFPPLFSLPSPLPFLIKASGRISRRLLPSVPLLRSLPLQSLPLRRA